VPLHQESNVVPFVYSLFKVAGHSHFFFIHLFVFFQKTTIYSKDKMRAWLGTTTTGHKGQTRRSASSRETDVREVGHVIDKNLLSTINKILIDKLSIRSFCDELRSYLRREEFREMRREFSTALVTLHVLGDEISSRVRDWDFVTCYRLQRMM
jgi:hypothetical protein